VLDEALLLRSARSSFCATITNSEAQRFELLDAGGRPVSSMTAYADLLPHDEGVSVERAAPDAPDVASSYCHSRADSGPTPGEENGVLVFGCEQE
jgi:hypothetical protein